MLSSFVSTQERVITIEDAAELRLAQPHVIGLEARPATVEGRGEVTVRDLVRNALRMRAAKHVGETSRRDCPVCNEAKLKLVTFVYGDGLKQDNGRVWPLDVGLSMAADRPGAWCYVVEVCTECHWNHLHEAFVARAG